MATDENRRPLASRGSKWAAALTRQLAATSVTPNQISMASMVMAAVAGAAFWFSHDAAGWAKAALLVIAALFMQLRLLCNLLDGMVAIEAGKSAKDGAFWNEFPDRIADIFIFVGAGVGAGHIALGWAAAALSVLTAYVREHGRACGAPADYSGPMAKQHRMAVMTLAALVAASEPFWNRDPIVLKAALWIVAIGSAMTALRRAMRLVNHLRSVVR
ncbi:MAG: CDP-alcohol phosphatidyltransferase family protein [Rhizobiaceae bacterium]